MTAQLTLAGTALPNLNNLHCAPAIKAYLNRDLTQFLSKIVAASVIRSYEKCHIHFTITQIRIFTTNEQFVAFVAIPEHHRLEMLAIIAEANRLYQECMTTHTQS